MTTTKLCCLLAFAASIIFVEVTGTIHLRNVINDNSKLWKRHKMAYGFNSNFDVVGNQRNLIEQWIWELGRAVNVGNDTCFTFSEKKYDATDYLYIIKLDKGRCFTESVGKKGHGTRQSLYLTDNCVNKRNITSLLSVTMGLYHEHQRPDRDTYIQVHMDNVQNEAKSQFNVIPSGDTDLLGLPYDFHSVTHFGPYAFAVNTSLPTITTNVSGVSFGERDTLSFYDVFKLQTLYECTKGYTMFGNGVNRLTQKSVDIYYPQWRNSSEQLPGYMTTGCTKHNAHGPYTLTVLNGAKWTSKFPLPPGNFCVSVDVCIASSSPDIKSYIQLMEGQDKIELNYTQPGGQWKKLNMTYTPEQEWTMVLKSHIMWGEDILALDNVIVREGRCG